MTNNKVEPSVIEREFNAPIELVFDAWTQVDHLNHWMFPMQGCTCEFVSATIENGGTSLHKVTMPNGHEMWLFTKYIDVSKPDTLSFLQYMSNENGDIIPMDHIPDWPKDMLATLKFQALSAERTKLSFYWEPMNPTPEEIAAFEATRDDHQRGWGAGMEQLEHYLCSLA